ncbi:YwaF family protein [Clostridium cuniculi]|uniref:TMEM164 family acyltransferase n=1 Tax=Clostridium cuniculi TaxID=2548455 RepID=UPI0018AA1D88|nr:YwaF family protein [Clostridium cuniculi]
MDILNQFWAPREIYEATGMFTSRHMVLLVLSLVVLSALIYVSRKITNEQIKRLTKYMAIFITMLEGIKIFFNFYRGYTWINTWLPISFCSIFIYALWLSGYGKGKWKELGEAFIAGVSIVAGATYLLFPSTSLRIYPIWHYLCMYSMLFHTLMVYMGILYLFKLEIKLEKSRFNKFTKLYCFFAVIAIYLNTFYGSNLMLLKKPFKIPVPFLHELFASAPWLYTIVVFLVYLYVPYYITVYLNRFINEKRKVKLIKENESFNQINIIIHRYFKVE